MSLLQIYGAQYHFFNEIAYSVANPYVLVKQFAEQRSLSDFVRHVGLIFAMFCNLAFLIYLWRRRDTLRSITGIAVAGALSLMVEVFALPKMHERYYFPANLLLLLLVGINPRRFWLPALLLQCASVYTYRPYLYGTANHASIYVLPVLAVVLVFYFLFKEFERLHRSSHPSVDVDDKIMVE